MKRLALGFISLLFLSGCGYQSIFDGSDSGVLAPVDLSKELGDEYADFFRSDDFRICAQHVFYALREEGQIIGQYADYAVVLNDAYYLDDVHVDDVYTPGDYEWPDIDFNKYSLVLGWWAEGGTGWYLKDQRIKKTLLGKVTVYLHLCLVDGLYFHDNKKLLFGALYPKLPSGPAKVERWYDEK